VGVSTHDEGFAGRLSELLSIHSDASVEWKVYAKSGYTAKNLKDIIIPSIDERTVDLIVIGLGGNDAFTLNTPWAWKKTIRELILDLRAKFENVPIVFMNMPPIKEFPAFTWLMKNSIGNLVEIFGNELAEAVKEFDHVYFHSRRISFHDWETRFQLTEEGAQFFSDGVHPSKLTYQTWAKDISMFIIENKVLH
jgi:lysophospholipase L1-like esterase